MKLDEILYIFIYFFFFFTYRKKREDCLKLRTLLSSFTRNSNVIKIRPASETVLLQYCYEKKIRKIVLLKQR